jgi:hypothetical protein
MELQLHPDPAAAARKLSKKPVRHIPFAEFTVNKLLMMDRGTV